MTTFALNKKARHDYLVLDTIEAGIVLHGHEVKSVKKSQVNLKGSYVLIDKDGEVWLLGAHISPYQQSAQLKDYDPYRQRKLLMHRREVNKLVGTLAQSGLTMVPLSVYSKGNKIKIELAVVRGKKKADKREDIKKRDISRDIERAIKERF